MKDSLIAFILRATGAGWIWKKFDGIKTNLGVLIATLSGGALMLSGAANLLTAAHACEAMSCIVGLVRGATTNPDFKVMMEGSLALGGALGILGVGHKIVKAEAATRK